MKTIAILTLCTSPGTFVPIVHQFTAERGMGSWTSFARYLIATLSFAVERTNGLHLASVILFSVMGYLVWVISGARRSHGWFTAAPRASNGSFFLVSLTVSIMCVTDGLDSTGTGWWVSGSIRVMYQVATNLCHYTEKRLASKSPTISSMALTC